MRKLIINVLAVSLFSLVTRAEPSNFVIRHEGSNFLLQIHRPVPLNTLLDAFCATSAADCEGTALASSIMVPPMTVTGEWSDVLNMLLHGTRLNYVGTAAVAGRRGRVILQQPGPEKIEAISVTRATEDSPSASTVVISSGFSAIKALNGDPDASLPVAVLRDSNSPDRNPKSDGVLATAVSGGMTRSDPTFNPDFHEASPVSLGSPFPDANGDYSARGSGSLTVSPFPDGNGHPIPISSQSDGHSIEWPFPSTGPR
jgi:hypothetical protein